MLDTKTVSRLKAGDAKALREIYDAIAPQAFGHAKEMIDDEDSALQIVEAVFKKIWEERSGLPGTPQAIETLILAQVHGRAVELIYLTRFAAETDDKDADAGLSARRHLTGNSNLNSADILQYAYRRGASLDELVETFKMSKEDILLNVEKAYRGMRENVK